MKRVVTLLVAISMIVTGLSVFPVTAGAGGETKADPAFIDFSHPDIRTYFSGKHDVDVQSVEDPEHGRAARLYTTKATNDPYITFNYKKYVTALGLPVLSADDYKLVVLKIKQTGCTDNAFELFYYTGNITWAVAGNSVWQYYDLSDSGWQYLVFDMSSAANWKGTINGFRFDFMFTGANQGAGITVGKMFFAASLSDMAKALESEAGEDPNAVTAEEALRAEALLDSAEDPAPDVPNDRLVAEYEDAGIDLWFDHSFSKTPADCTVSTGMYTYQIRMAKNEIEGAQFLLASDTERTGLRAELTPFTNAAGKTLRHQICYGYYFDDIEGEKIPDPIPVLEEDFSLPAGESRMFLIKVFTESGTDQGQYSAVLRILDSEGREVKKADVYVYVWGFALPEAPSCKIMADLSWWGIYSANAPWLYDGDDGRTYAKYYDYLLENKVNAYNLPYLMTASQSANPFKDKRVVKYLDDPRVQCFNPVGFGAENFTEARIRNAYDFLSENDEWLEKAYFYPVDEPLAVHSGNGVDAAKTLDRVNECGALIKSIFGENYKMIIPMCKNEALDDPAGDYFKYVEDAVTVWCPHSFFYNTLADYTADPRLLYEGYTYNIYGTSTHIGTYSEALEKKLGSFKDRMARQQEEGDEVFWYVTRFPHHPEITLSIDDTEVEHRLLFWQQKLYDVDGFLYYLVNDWHETDPWDSLHEKDTQYPYNNYGNGVLVYNGFKDSEGNAYISREHYDELEDKSYDAYPVGSLRLESVRDGADDYDYFTILDELYGDGTSDLIIRQITTSLGRYSTDSELYNALRIATGNLIHAKLAGDRGDIDTDGDVDLDDVIALLRHVILPDIYGLDGYTQTPDFNSDSTVDIHDVIRLLQYCLFPDIYKLE